MGAGVDLASPCTLWGSLHCLLAIHLSQYQTRFQKKSTGTTLREAGRKPASASTMQ